VVKKLNRDCPYLLRGLAYRHLTRHKAGMTNRLYYGDNLDVLREHIASESVDLIYLDPPFNSNANYNILFKSPAGKAADSQIEAFEDTWHWNDKAEAAFHDVMTSGNTDVAELLRAMRGFLKENDMMAYLAMMAVRLIELHRVLKPTGSLYLHCDPTASHYLKLLLDGVFGAGYVNEIIWKRYGAHNDVGQGSKHYGRVHDTVFFYSKSADRKWRQLFMPLDPEYVKSTYRLDDGDGRLYTTTPLTGPGGAEKGNPVFEWNGHTRAWRYNKETMQRLHDEGKLHYSKTGYVRQKLYLEDSRGVPVQTIWNDISSLVGSNKERLGYPTQKPLALLERIIDASSNEGDVVLDPFCGCGTAVDAAQKLGRQWIGIDVTHLSIGLIERRMKDRYGESLDYQVVGTPNDLDSALKLAADEPHQFQYWITQVVDGQPYQGGRKGMDRGIDGYLYFTGHNRATEAAIISVKAGKNVGVAMVRDLKGVIEREKAPIGIFICAVSPTREMDKEAAAAGVYEGVDGRTYPRLQIYTLAEYFAGLRPKVPLLDRQAAYKKAARDDGSARQGNLI
jgi:site-specific DNA-methyltransferase (adenine-specific)